MATLTVMFGNKLTPRTKKLITRVRKNKKAKVQTHSLSMETEFFEEELHPEPVAHFDGTVNHGAYGNRAIASLLIAILKGRIK